MDIPELEAYEIIVTQKQPDEADDGSAPIDYGDSVQVRDLMAKHLARIFIATHKNKIKKEVDKIKAKCK